MSRGPCGEPQPGVTLGVSSDFSRPSTGSRPFWIGDKPSRNYARTPMALNSNHFHKKCTLKPLKDANVNRDLS